jgi:hypothetical protein
MPAAWDPAGVATMHSFGGPPRKIIEEASFEAQKATVGLTAERFDDIMVGVIFGLASDPAMIGTRVLATNLWVHITREFPGSPALAFLYTFDDAEVHLWWVEVYDPAGAAAGTAAA